MFSEKQLKIMAFPYTGYDALICDGAVRSGKTSVMSLSFFLWAMGRFNGCTFALCGKSVGAVERNIVTPPAGGAVSAAEFCRLLQPLRPCNYGPAWGAGEPLLPVRRQGRELLHADSGYHPGGGFAGRGGPDAPLFCGTGHGPVLRDRAKLWFNCNPEGPQHWFRQEWILKAEEHKALHLHFTMEDNPALDEATRARYRSMYAGVFYQRYILGLWVMSEGLIYDMFDQTENVYRTQERPVDLEWVSQRTVACDYGTANLRCFWTSMTTME